MQNVRWLHLKDRLVDRGWTARDDAMYAPHHTMWFSRSSDDANMLSFRERMKMAARESAAYVDRDVDHAALHLDLVSLVEALDEVIEGVPARSARN
jgi:hypothetical protein